MKNYILPCLAAVALLSLIGCATEPTHTSTTTTEKTTYTSPTTTTTTDTETK